MDHSTEGQSPFTEEAQPVAEKTEVLLHRLVGEYLATGYTNNEILELLQTEQGLSEEDAQSVLRAVYDSWSSVREGLNLQSEDNRNWHHHLRMKLLQSAIKDKSTPSQNLALRILDSIASLQGITTTQAQPVPLAIELVEKKPESENKPQEMEVKTNG